MVRFESVGLRYGPTQAVQAGADVAEMMRWVGLFRRMRPRQALSDRMPPFPVSAIIGLLAARGTVRRWPPQLP